MCEREREKLFFSHYDESSVTTDTVLTYFGSTCRWSILVSRGDYARGDTRSHAHIVMLSLSPPPASEDTPNPTEHYNLKSAFWCSLSLDVDGCQNKVLHSTYSTVRKRTSFTSCTWMVCIWSPISQSKDVFWAQLWKPGHQDVMQQLAFLQTTDTYEVNTCTRRGVSRSRYISRHWRDVTTTYKAAESFFVATKTCTLSQTMRFS